MKLLEVFRILDEAQFLIERDILNAKELKQWAQSSAQRIQHPQAQTWYASQLYKFLINRYQEGARPLMQAPADAPEWLAAKIQAGEPVLNIEPQQELRQQAEGVIDWLNAETPSNLRMTWEDAAEAQKEWHSELKRATRVTKLTPEQAEGLVTIRDYPDDYRWVDVQTEVCLQHEGTMMGHCVGQGGYTQGVSEGKTKIISLRDPKGLAHATIEGVSENPINISKEMMDQNANQLDLFNKTEALELSGMEVHQIKGKENKAVPTKYRDYVQDFLTQFQVNNFSSAGLSDLENSGLFKLRKGGYATVDEVGQKMVDVEDGTYWSRVSNELVELKDYHNELHAKWYLNDKGGRGIASAQEQEAGVIDSLGFPYGEDKKQYKPHVNALFNQGLKPGEGMYSSYGGLQLYGLAVGEDGETVGEPQVVGTKVAEYDGGTFYKTKEEKDTFWLMRGDHVVSHFTITPYQVDEGPTGNVTSYTLIFTMGYGIPGGSMPKFLEEVQGFIDGPVVRVSIQNRIIPIGDMGWEPGPDDDKVMEQDDVSYYSDESDVYHAIDSHGHLLFTMDIANSSFEPLMVNDVNVAGFYAIYLIDGQDIDIGDYNRYDSFAQNFMEETGWFLSDTERAWFYMDEKYPTLMTITDWDTNGDRQVVMDKEESTMAEFWSETSLQDSGLSPEYFADAYNQIYTGGTTEWDDEHHPDEEDDTRASTDYEAEGNGDPATVTHPVSDGTMRVTR